MPTTTYNIDRIVERVTDRSRETIRDMLNEIQLIVYSQDCFQTQKLDSATGMPPFLVTVDGQFQYDAPSDCRRTAVVFTLNPVRRQRERPTGPRREYYFRGRGYYGVNISTRDATPADTLAKVIFQENPGTTTENYYHLYYIKPTPILDEDTQLTLPDEVHYLLRKAVIAMFSTEQYGESAFDDTVIERVAKKIRNSLNRGLQNSIAGETPWREEMQDDYPPYYNGFRP